MPVAQGAPAPPPDDVIIDIPYANLHEWCIQRKLMNPNWRKLLQEVQAQVKAALASLPEVQGVSAIKSISKLDYFQCKQVGHWSHCGTAQHSRHLWTQVVDALSKDTTTNKRSWLGKYVNRTFWFQKKYIHTRSCAAQHAAISRRAGTPTST